MDWEFEDSAISLRSVKGCDLTEIITFTELRKIMIEVIVLLIRVLNSLLVSTYFDPDEHYQSHEIAHLAVHGYGYKTWEWRVGLRSFLHPALLALFYTIATPFYAQLLIKVRNTRSNS
jgi:hypothetical protein